MARIAKRAFLGTLSNVAGTLATVPTGKKWEVIDVTVLNTSATAQTFFIYVTVGANTASICAEAGVGLNVMRDYPRFHVLQAGEAIKGVTTTNAVLQCIITVMEVDV